MRPVKMMVMGDSGVGKTGALAALLPDYELAVLDLEDGSEILEVLAPPEAQDRLHIVRVADRIDIGRVTMQTQVAETIMRIFDAWPGFGPIEKWPPERVLVLDSLTALGDAMMRWAQRIQRQRGRGQPDSMGPAATRTEFGIAMMVQEQVIARLFSSATPCSVIVNAHVKYMPKPGARMILRQVGPDRYEEEVDPRDVMAYPSALGSKLPPMIARHVNTLLFAELRGSKRLLHVKPVANVAVKCPYAAALDSPLPLETGLRTVFEAARKTRTETQTKEENA